MTATKAATPVVKYEGQDISETDMILVDGKNALWRAAYAQTAKLGFQKGGEFFSTGAVYGFLEAVLAIAHRAPNADVYICWEGSRKNRRAIVPSYKAHRDADEQVQEMWKIIGQQQSVLRGLLAHTSWVQARSSKWEADDTISTLAKAGKGNKMNVLIYSNDKDLYQCLFEADPDNPDQSEHWVRQYAVKKKDTYLVHTVKRLLIETGLKPWQIPHMKALAGDSSDGYKGVPGVGEGTAAKWLTVHRTADNVVEACRQGLIKGKRAATVLEHYRDVRACYEIAIARDDVPIKFSETKSHLVELSQAMKGLRFHSLCSIRILQRMTD